MKTKCDFPYTLLRRGIPKQYTKYNNYTLDDDKTNI